jgi:hypothetical protein
MNSEIVMKRRGGTKSKSIERMLNVFQSTFSCTSNGNREESANIWLVLTIQTVMPVGYTVLLLSAKTRQENQRNEASRLRKCIKKSSALSHVKCEEVSL